MFEAVVEFWGQKDARMAEYPLMESPLKTVIFSSIYLSFVKVIGPAWMKKRKPYEFRSIMVAYNALLVAISSWMFLNFGYYGWFRENWNWWCQPIDTSRDPVALKMVQVCWIFYLTKLLEYGDTVMFVLRKKDSQINFLHVFHHTVVPVTAWYGVAYGPGGYNTSFCMVNVFVHIWMYLYYGLAAMGPTVQKYLWWKKYLTSLQLIQFISMACYFTQACMFAPKECKMTGFLVSMSLVQAFVFFSLFMNFYFKSYVKKPLNKYHSASQSVSNGSRTKEH